MPLDFQYTCGDIDGAIQTSRDLIRGTLRECIEDICPKLSEDTVSDLVNEYDMSDDVTAEFEVLRGLNEDMRSQADSQIEDLESAVSALEYELDDYQEQVSNLEQQLKEIE
mgnify:CR=1 FL=1|tara:strand:- start:127 stop:459 length:333 start_codon:yes stop_codon:yes gene_type:complete